MGNCEWVDSGDITLEITCTDDPEDPDPDDPEIPGCDFNDEICLCELYGIGWCDPGGGGSTMHFDYNLSRSGFKTKAVKEYEHLINGIVWDKAIYFGYASELHDLKKQDSALLFLNRSAKYIYGDQTAKLFAAIYVQKGMNDSSAYYYNQAVSINPKSYRNRFALMNFYVESNQPQKAVEVEEFILSMPYRKTERINVGIRRQVQLILEKLQ